MSSVDIQVLLNRRAYTRQYDRDLDPFGNISPIHPLHPMRKMETIIVSSLREMEDTINIGTEIMTPTFLSDAFDYAVSPDPIPKPEITIRIDEGIGGIVRLAVTTTVPSEFYRVDGAVKAIKGLLSRRLDTIESEFWSVFFYASSHIITPANVPATFREIFALAKTFLSRIAPTNSFDAMLGPRAFGAATFENTLNPSILSSYTELQAASGTINLIPSSNSFDTFEPVFVYPSTFPSLCKRYIYERYYDEVVVDTTGDTNLHRITAERYLLPLIPRDYYFNANDNFAAPIATFSAIDAINNISIYFDPSVLTNLNYVTSIT